MKILHWNPKTGKAREIEMADELAANALAHKLNVTEVGAANPFNKKSKIKSAVDASEDPEAAKVVGKGKNKAK